jgi:hypothetical protein
VLTSRSMILDELKKREAGDIVVSSKLQYSQIPDTEGWNQPQSNVRSVGLELGTGSTIQS